MSSIVIFVLHAIRFLVCAGLMFLAFTPKMRNQKLFFGILLGIFGLTGQLLGQYLIALIWSICAVLYIVTWVHTNKSREEEE